MSTNLQSRSASVSTAKNDAVKGGIRSSSFSTNFFHGKDALSFFYKEEVPGSVDNPEPLGPTIEAAAASPAQDLDIVGALSTLNLDEDLDSVVNQDAKSSTSSAGNTEALAKGPATFAPHFLNPATAGGTNGLPQNRTLTPNPPAVGAFTGSLSSLSTTPASAWSTSFVPFSAPPFAYPVGDARASSELAMLITPFELPDDRKDAKLGASIQPIGVGADGAMMNSTSPPMNAFGGVLDSRFAFTNFADKSFEYLEGGESDPKNDKSFELENDNYDFDKLGHHVNMQPSQVSVPSVWNLPQQYTHLVNRGEPFADPAMLDLFGQSHMIPNQMPHRFGGGYSNNQANYGGNAGHHHAGNSRRHNNYNSGNNNMSAAVNVHRKMHSRRKGDDASKYANAKLLDFTGDIYSLCKDQHGCRFLQRQLDLGIEVAAKRSSEPGVLANDVAATIIFNEIYMKIVELMTDPFGNYLIQKLFENVSSDQRLILVKNAAPEFIRIALDPHGTRALQKLVECVDTKEESRLIISSLSPHIVPLSRDLNGNHVVQKCLQKLKAEDNQFIFDTASEHCNEIATHRHGCCVLQRCLDHGSMAQRKQLSLKVAESATKLSLDPFGNYVVQYVLSRGDEESITLILNHIRANVISLSLHKFGSNVIEKSLRIKNLTDEVIDVLLKNSDKFNMLLNDAFGNYVLQTSLDVANPSDLAKLAESLQPLLPNIKNTPHGRRIMIKIQNII